MHYSITLYTSFIGRNVDVLILLFYCYPSLNLALGTIITSDGMQNNVTRYPLCILYVIKKKLSQLT